MVAKTIEFMELYEAAIDFERLNVKNIWVPGQLVVVQDPETDILGFCTLDKNFKLCVHLGIEGLTGYLEAMYSSDSELLTRLTCLTLDFKPSAQLDEKDVLHLENLGFDLTETKKWPQFRNFRAGFLTEFIKDGWECRFFAQIIKQFYLIAEEIKLTGKKISLEGDEVLFLSHTVQGEWQVDKVSMNFFLKQIKEEVLPYENELEAYRINQLPTTSMTFELTQFFLPNPIKKSESERGFFPLVTAAFEKKTQRLVFAEIIDSEAEAQKEIVEKFSSLLLNDLTFKPDCILTDSEQIMIIFSDFCNKTRIKLERVEALDTANRLIMDIIEDEGIIEANHVEVSSFDREVAVILETAKGICRTLLNSNLLNSKLASEARNKFTSVIELIHVVMIGNFKEFPDTWTANNMEFACKNILPSLLSEEELKYVPDIIASYVDIVGEAETLPNYQEIKYRMELIKE